MKQFWWSTSPDLKAGSNTDRNRDDDGKASQSVGQTGNLFIIINLSNSIPYKDDFQLQDQHE